MFVPSPLIPRAPNCGCAKRVKVRAPNIFWSFKWIPCRPVEEACARWVYLILRHFYYILLSGPDRAGKVLTKLGIPYRLKKCHIIQLCHDYGCFGVLGSRDYDPTMNNVKWYRVRIPKFITKLKTVIMYHMHTCCCFHMHACDT